MKEKDFQTLFGRWVKYKYEQSALFELKLTHEKSIPFSAVLDHQEVALHAAKHQKLFYKISDESSGYKPADCFVLVQVPAYVVIQFYKRGCKDFYLVDIDIWLNEKRNSVRRSLTEERAAQIGKKYTLN